MARHSHWHNIQITKGKVDAKRAKVFTKLAKKLTIAAREGVGLPSAIEAARAANMTKDAIERAIARGTGGGESRQLEEVMYEGFAPGGVAVLIAAVTDNRNRTVSELKTIASKNGGSIGAPGTVRWMFDHKAVVRVEDRHPEAELDLIEAGADDILTDDHGMTIIGEVKQLQAIKAVAEKLGFAVTSAELEYVASQKVIVPLGAQQNFEDFIEAIEDNDDVVNVYTNDF